MQKFKEYIAENHLHVFDIDDTLFRTPAKIHVQKDGQTVHKLSPAEYNDHKLAAGHSYDYSEFKSAEIFNKGATPIGPMIDRLKSIHAKVKASGKGRVIMNTARPDLDDKHKFTDTFRQHGVDIDDIHIHRAGNVHGPGMTTGEAKNKVLGSHLSTGKYTHVSLYDDSTDNLDKFNEFASEHPNVKFHAYHVQHDGSIKRHK